MSRPGHAGRPGRKKGMQQKREEQQYKLCECGHPRSKHADKGLLECDECGCRFFEPKRGKQ